MSGCIMTSHMVKYLSLYVNYQSASTYTKQIWLCPVVAKFFFHQDHPQHGILCCANTTGGLKANLKYRSQSINQSINLFNMNMHKV